LEHSWNRPLATHDERAQARASPREIDQAKHRPLLLGIGSPCIFSAWTDRFGRQIAHTLIVPYVEPRSHAGKPQLWGRSRLAKEQLDSLRQPAAKQPANANHRQR